MLSFTEGVCTVWEQKYSTRGVDFQARQTVSLQRPAARNEKKWPRKSGQSANYHSLKTSLKSSCSLPAVLGSCFVISAHVCRVHKTRGQRRHHHHGHDFLEITKRDQETGSRKKRTPPPPINNLCQSIRIDWNSSKFIRIH